MKKIIIFLLFTLLLTACNLPFNQAEPTLVPTATTAPTATPQPTPTPTPTVPPTVRVEQGDALLLTGDYPAALQEFQAALNAAPDTETQAAALLGVGQTYAINGDCASALSVLQNLLTQYPQAIAAAPAYYQIAECHMQTGLPALAAQEYLGYIQLRPGVLDAMMYEKRGDALQAAGDYLAAVEAYDAAIAASSGITDDLQIKKGSAYAAVSDYTNAIRTFTAVYESTASDYTKATANLLAGQTYMALGLPEQAYARYQESVLFFPTSYDTYTGLVALVNADQPVDEFNRGLVDYYAGQYGYAIEAFDRYLKANPTHDGAVHHYKALCQRALDQPEQAIAEWQALIQDHSGDRFWADAHDEIADTYWYWLGDYTRGAQILLDYIEQVPGSDDAPGFLFRAAQIMERGGYLSQAAEAWERLMNEYPNAEDSYYGLFLAGITYYRLGNYPQALLVFQRVLVLAGEPGDQAMAYLWIGKCQLAQNDAAAAQASWKEAAQRDPTGYYSERAAQLLASQVPFTQPAVYDLAYDLTSERVEADTWMRVTFGLPAETDLSGLDALAADPRMVKGNALWELGLYRSARGEYETLRLNVLNDAAATYRLMNFFLERGLYRSAILSARQVLDLAGLDDAGTLEAPAYFNHIRFGAYYKDLVLDAAAQEGVPPLLVFAVIRQESFFEGFAESSAGARGLMQIMPATGQEIATSMSWPVGYTTDDLYRPAVNIRMGTRYLSRQYIYLNSVYYGALAAYNGGPGNARSWSELSGADPDLYLECIRYDQTRDYVRRVFENFEIYASLYAREP